MTARALALSVVVLAAVVAASLAGDPSPKTVAAKRYWILWAAGGVEELSHGGGRRIHEIFLPDAKVVVGFFPAEDDPERFRIYARKADAPRNELTGFRGEPPSELVDVRVPAELAEQFVAFARLQEKVEAESIRIGKEGTERLRLPALPRQE